MLGINSFKNPRIFEVIKSNNRFLAAYVQGQEPEPKIREYFYFIDHQGMVLDEQQLLPILLYLQLFLDDARMKNFTSCFKEKKFLRFFFSRLRLNWTNRYKEFPYVSLCGKERNYVRCDDYPIVFTHVFNKTNDDGDCLAYNHAGELLNLKFVPQQLFMLPETGRVYHPAPEKVGSIGLVRSKLAIELSKSFVFDEGEGNPPTKFVWKGIGYVLDTKWFFEAVKPK